MKKARQLSSQDLSSLSRQLALVIDSELSLQEGLSLVREQSRSKTLRALLQRTDEKLTLGHSLGEAFAEEEGILPHFYIEMIRMGEQSGNLEKVLSRVADSYEKDADIQSRVGAAVTYPIILSILMLAVIILLFIKVLPMFDEVLASLGGQMPGITNVFMAIGRFFSTYYYILLIIIGSIVLIVVLMRQTPGGIGILDSIKLKMPIQKGILKDTACIRFSRNLAMLLRSGISVAESVRMTSATLTNTRLKKLVLDTAERIETGETLKSALGALGLFPGLLLRLLAVAEGTGHTDDMLDKTADVMEDELGKKLTRLTTVLEPALIIVLSLIIGVVLLSVILPVARIMNSVG
jgi:type IV pilus assembly protein PilC